MTAQRHNRESGFSMLETLIGLTLTALIAASLFGAIRVGIRLMSSGEANVAESEQVRVLGLIESWMELAVPDTFLNAEDGTLFAGSESEVSFVIAGITGPGDGGLSRISLRTEESEACDGQYSLLMDWTSISPTEPSMQGPGDTRLVLDCQSQIAFNYFGSSDMDQSHGWKRVWLPSGTVPQLISLRTSSRSGGHQILARPQFATAVRYDDGTY